MEGVKGTFGRQFFASLCLDPMDIADSDAVTDVEDSFLPKRTLDDCRFATFVDELLLGETESTAAAAVNDCGNLIRRPLVCADGMTPGDFRVADSAAKFSASCKLMRRAIFSGVFGTYSWRKESSLLRCRLHGCRSNTLFFVFTDNESVVTELNDSAKFSRRPKDFCFDLVVVLGAVDSKSMATELQDPCKLNIRLDGSENFGVRGAIEGP